MDYKDLMPMYLERCVAVQTLWFDYATIVLLLLAFLAAFKPTEFNKYIRWAVFGIFGIFVGANADALWEITNQRIWIGERLISVEPTFPTAWAARGLELGVHAAADILVVALIVVIHYRQRKGSGHTQTKG
ncbi:MAG TPA: hypothetical protein VN933_06645 [Candidatus Eremiobacteraceae bacterium]|nr:hypothetical protein [Candidatus Eremiobacteraceae bacterium]